MMPFSLPIKENTTRQVFFFVAMNDITYRKGKYYAITVRINPQCTSVKTSKKESFQTK